MQIWGGGRGGGIYFVLSYLVACTYLFYLSLKATYLGRFMYLVKHLTIP